MNFFWEMICSSNCLQLTASGFWIQSILLKDTNIITSDSSLKSHLIISVFLVFALLFLLICAVAIVVVAVVVVIVVAVVVVIVVAVVVVIVVVVVVVFFSNSIVVVVSSHPLELLGRRWRLPIPAPTILDGPPILNHTYRLYHCYHYTTIPLYWMGLQYSTIPAIPLYHYTG